MWCSVFCCLTSPSLFLIQCPIQEGPPDGWPSDRLFGLPQLQPPRTPTAKLNALLNAHLWDEGDWKKRNRVELEELLA